MYVNARRRSQVKPKTPSVPMTDEQRKWYRAINRRLPHFFRLKRTNPRWVNQLGSFFVIDVRTRWYIDTHIEDLEAYYAVVCH